MKLKGGTVMDWIINNWYVAVGIVALLIAVGFIVYKFFNLPTDKQIACIKEWLKYAVAIAEKELGSGTGQLKLRYVYNMFVEKFPSISKIIPFETFSTWVDEALVWLEKQLSTNNNISQLIK